METEALRVGVIMRRRPLDNRWQPYAWEPAEIVADDGSVPAPCCISAEESDTRWLVPGFEVRLYTDEGEGYFLNATSPKPCWFVMWRMEEVNGQEIAMPKAVTLSYNEAARMMDGGEQVDTLPAPQEIVESMRAFAEMYYHPEPKKKRRKPSFEGGAAVEEMAKAEGGLHGRR